MSDEELRPASFTADDCNAADAERPNEPPPASTPRRGAALSVLWWEADEEPRPGPEVEEVREEQKKSA